MTDREQADGEREQNIEEQTAMRARLRLAAIVESSDDAIIGEDMNGIITDWNKGAERLYGYTSHEVIGKPISILLPPDRAAELVDIMRKLQAGETIKHFETARQKKDGTRIDVSLTISPIVHPEGRILGASTIARDISAIVKKIRNGNPVGEFGKRVEIRRLQQDCLGVSSNSGLQFDPDRAYSPFAIVP